MEEYLFKKAVDLAFGRLSETLRKTSADLAVTTDDMESALNHHIRDVKNWSSEVSFSDLRSAKQTSDIYIPLDVFVYPRRRRISPNDSIGLVPFEKIFEDPHLKHLIVLGHPGAGKTTSMKHLCHRLLFDADFLPDRFTCPLLIRLRDLNVRRRPEDAEAKDDIIIPRLEEILGLRIRYPSDLLKKKSAAHRKAVRNRIVTETVDSLNLLVILDGFDEIVFKKDREAVIEEFRLLTNILERSVVAVTARTGEFNYHVPKASQFEISPLTDAQVRNFASRWLGDEDGKLLYSEIIRSPFADTTIRPLTLAHLCAIFERIGKIPEKPKTVYRKIVNLLLEEWDQQRSVKRESSYAGFEVDRKFEFLSHLAYVLTTSVKGSVFDRRELIDAYARIHDNFGLPRGMLQG